MTTYSSDDQEVWDPVAKLDDIKRQEDYEDDLRSTEKPPEQVDKNKVLWLTKMTMKKYEFATIRDNEQILYFHREFRSWVSNGERLIKEYCQMVYEPIKDAEMEAIINQISRRTGVDRSKFNSDKECITTDNCYLNVLTGEVYKRRPAQYATIRLPHKYDPKARCPKIAKFLSQVLKPNDVRLALQYIGYCLLRDRPKYKKALMSTGKGDNGKSVFLRLIEIFLGLENCSSIKLQELCGSDRFAAVSLDGKLANVYDDLPKDKLEDAGTFKCLVSGDRMKVERKYRDHYYFFNESKLIFSANKIPVFEEDDFAFFSRWIIFVFEKYFDINDRNVNQINELTTEEEMSGLLNLALISLRQLIKDGGFIHSSDVEETRQLYNRHSDTVRSFIYNMCEIHQKISSKVDLPSIPCTELHHYYSNYCSSQDDVALDIEKFGSEIAAFHIPRKKRGARGSQEWHYIGVTLKDESYVELDESKNRTLF